jgi:NAD(P)H-dependent FMN reductase
MKVVAIAGALREKSYNKQLLRLAIELLEKEGVEVDRVDLRALGIPFYDGDVEASTGLPAPAQELVARIAAANGLLIASPEYNFSVPAVLKNAIDWVTRAKPMPLRGKTAVLLSASPSLVGGNRALWVLRMSLEGVGVHVYPDMFSLATAHQAFDDAGQLKEEGLARFLRSVISGYVRVTRAHLAAPPK